MCTLVCSTFLVNTIFPPEKLDEKEAFIFRQSLRAYNNFLKHFTSRMANRSAVKLNSGQPDFVQFNNLACETAGGKVKTDHKYSTLSFSITLINVIQLPEIL